MPHPLVLGLFDDSAAAADAARRLRDLGIPRERVSIVARSHDEEGALARTAGASPGSEMEDSAAASRLGELGAHLIAAIAVVMPGIGPIVADGPLAAGMGEAAGHLAGGIGRMLEAADIGQGDAERLASRIHAGAFLVGAHVDGGGIDQARQAFTSAGATEIVVGTWAD